METLQAAKLKSEHQNIFLVRGVEYDGKPSLEIKSVREFELDDLPLDLRPRWWRPLLLEVKARVQSAKSPRDAQR